MCVGLQQQQGESGRGPFGQVLPQLAGCFQILYPLKQQPQQQPQQQQLVLQDLLLPNGCGGFRGNTSSLSGASMEFSSPSPQHEHEQQKREQSEQQHQQRKQEGEQREQQQQEQQVVDKQLLQRLLGVLSIDEQQLVVVEGELLLAAVTSLHSLLAAAGLPSFCGTIEFALPQLLRPLLE